MMMMMMSSSSSSSAAISSTSTTTTLDNLPKQFLTAMRTLFDIMDDKQSGFVNLTDIEIRWQDDGSKGLPKGVLESLRKVTPPNGMLSFERFCAGLKISLLRNQMEKRNSQSDSSNKPNISNQRPPSSSVPATIIDNNNKTVIIRPNNILTSHHHHQQQNNNTNIPTRTSSMPQLKEPSSSIKNDAAAIPSTSSSSSSTTIVNNNNNNHLYGPPKPPRSGLIIGMDRAEIRNALANWQMGLLNNKELNNKMNPSRSLGDGKAVESSSSSAAVPTSVNLNNNSSKFNNNNSSSRSRREPRRHTLQNGIDYNMLKRMKQIEQEKEVLINGLGGVEKAKDWYLKQIALVQEKMKYLGRMGHLESWSEAQQERLELQRARVLEVNRHLAALTESWERGGLPLHMNLAVQHHHQQIMPQNNHHHNHDERLLLKQQNRLLSEDVTKKNERIAALEREKGNLIQILQNLNRTNNNNIIISGMNEEAVF